MYEGVHEVVVFFASSCKVLRVPGRVATVQILVDLVVGAYEQLLDAEIHGFS